MDIIGSKQFIEKTKEALTILRRKSTREYNFVTTHIQRIFEYPNTFMYIYGTPTYYVSKSKIDNPIWYASCLFKEAWHKWYAHESMDNNKRGNSTLYDGLEYEIVSLQKQIKFLRIFDNTEELINQIKEEIEFKRNDKRKQIIIKGNKKFRKRTKKALNLLKQKDYFSYKTVIQNIRQIYQFDISPHTYLDLYQEKIAAFVNNAISKGDLKVYASALLHEACHAKLYKDASLEGENPEEECSGYSAEMYCLTRQIECMKKLNAHDLYIRHFIDYYDINWWEESNEVKLTRKH